MSNGSSPFGKGPKKPRAQSQPLAAADVLQALLQNSKSQLSDGFLRWRLEQNWAQIVGPTIANETVPAAYQKGLLFIWVRHSAWMQQLWYFQEPIKDKVNEYLGRTWVREVKFTLNRRAATTVPGEPGS